MDSRAKVIETFDVPLKVEMNDLGDRENGRLLAESERTLLEEILEELPAGQRYSKKELGKMMEERSDAWPKGKPASYGIFKDTDGSEYAIYKGEKHGKELGKGNFGKVKITQNIRTGEWVALKVQLLKDEEKEKIALREHKMLTAVGVSRGELVIREKDVEHTAMKERKANDIMKYAKGRALYKYLCDQPQLSAIRWLDLALQSVERIHEIHQQGILHCDIKVNNMLYDALSHRVTAVDFGFALKMDENGHVKDRKHGTPNYMAPELKPKIKAAGEVEYSTATDVYALGMMLQEICGFREMNDEDKGLPDKFFFTHSPLSADQELKELFERMTDKNPEKRPTLPDVIEALQTLRQELLPISQKTVGLVEINDYLLAVKGGQDELEAFIAALKSVDEVVLVDKKEMGGAIEYTEMRRLFEQKGIPVRHEVIISDDPAALMEAANDVVEEKGDEVSIAELCYFHSKKRPIQEIPEGMQIIEVTDHRKDYRKEIQEKSLPITNEQSNRVRDALDREKQRLIKIYSKPDKGVVDKEIVKRIEFLDSKMERLDQLKNDNKLSYFTLYKELKALERQILSENIWSKITFGLFKPQSVKNIRAVEQGIRKDTVQIPKLKPNNPA